MKIRVATQAALILGACLLAIPASAKPKLRSIGDLARALAAKLPRSSGLLVYVATPSWEGKQKGKRKNYHEALMEEIGRRLATALSTADPAARIVTRAQAGAELAKHGLQPLDVYSIKSDLLAVLLGNWARVATVAITTKVREKKDGFELNVEALDMEQNKHRRAKLTALISKTPQLQSLFSTPDKPIENSSGVYLPGQGGVGQPVCIYCPNPPFPDIPNRATFSGTVLLALTIGVSGKVTAIDVVKIPAGRGGRESEQNSIRTVRSWRMKPAKGPGGGPVPVRVLALLKFRVVP